MKRIAAITAAAALLGAGPAQAQVPRLQGPVLPSPLRFDRSLESLERTRILTPLERRQLEGGEQRRLQPRVIADSDHYNPRLLLEAALPNPSLLIWVELAADSDLTVIARELDLSLNELLKLNEASATARFKAGKWLVLPDHTRDVVAYSSRFVAGSLRTTAPLSSPPISKDVVEIKYRQTLSSFIRDHGITLQQLKDFNPGVQLSRMLVVGSKVRVARASPLLAMRPLRSGGASWPDLPGFSSSGSGSTMPVGTSYSAPDSAEKRRIREQIQQRRRTEQLAAAKRAEAERLAADRRAEAARIARLKREEERRKRYRLLGGCTYDWSSWGKSPSGVRSVKASNCSGITEVAVDCSNTKISKLRWSKWRGWEIPGTGFEDLVVESCANVLGASKPTYTNGDSGKGETVLASNSLASWPNLPGFTGSETIAPQNFIWPTKGIFTRGYGWSWGMMHPGIDIANKIGTPIVASKDGVISFAGWKSGKGYVVEMSHGDGSQTRYLHCSKLLVKKGELVTQGTRIALMGNTGSSTGSHLGFEIRRPGGAATDPLELLPGKASL